MLGHRCCTQAFSSCSERGLLFVAVHGLLQGTWVRALYTLKSTFLCPLLCIGAWQPDLPLPPSHKDAADFLDWTLSSQPIELEVGYPHSKGGAVVLSTLEPSQPTCKSTHDTPTAETDRIKGAIQKTAQQRLFKAAAAVFAQKRLCLKLAPRRF